MSDDARAALADAHGEWLVEAMDREFTPAEQRLTEAIGRLPAAAVPITPALLAAALHRVRDGDWCNPWATPETHMELHDQEAAAILDAVPDTFLGIPLRPRLPTDAVPVGKHEPGDSHRYRITCEVCGERGTIRLTVDPETALAPAPSEHD